MKVLAFFLSFLSVLVFTFAKDATTVTSSSVSHTTVWKTGTISGKLTTYQTLYSQVFMTTYTEADTSDLMSGEIGLGSQTDSLGGIRTYTQVTVSNAGNGPIHTSNAYANLAGFLFLVFGALI